MKPQILIIDDEPPVRELLSLFLRKKGFEVATACNGKQAEELLGHGPFQLVILDVGLNGENGLHLLTRFKSKHAELPVIIFSGEPEEGLPQKALAAGANGFLRKTDSLHNLFTEVCRHISP